MVLIQRKEKIILEKNTTKTTTMMVAQITKTKLTIVNTITNVKTIVMKRKIMTTRAETTMIKENIVNLIKRGKIITIESLNTKIDRKHHRTSKRYKLKFKIISLGDHIDPDF